MQKWVYYDNMGRNNPVCVDAGKITAIVPNYPKARESYGLVDSIVADGIRFVGNIKYIVLDIGCIYPFSPYPNASSARFVEFPKDLKHGDAVEFKNDIEFFDSEGALYTPICIDPRVLYIAHRGWKLLKKGEALTADEVENWSKDIPTRENALRWLVENGKRTECIPIDCVVDILHDRES